MSKITSLLLAIINLFLTLSGISTADRIVTKKAVLEVECRSDVCFPSDEVWDNGAQYPTLIELNYSGETNGTLLVTNEIFDKGQTCFRISESTDSGKTWKEISSVKETKTDDLEAAWEPCLFELPEQTGKYKKGTVILGEVSIDSGCRNMTQLSLFASTDSGYSWDEISVIDSAGGIGDGIWEPFFVYDSGYLYCFYSDDSDEVCSQTIVYKRSPDLVNWSDKVPVVRSENPDYRPGMPSVTKMGNGKYYLVFESFSEEGFPTRYKVTDDISKWNATDMGNTVYDRKGNGVHSAPCCIWIPQGGENGTLIVSGKFTNTGNNELMVSHDFGETYSSVKNPLPFSDKKGFGYSSSFFYSDSKKLLYYASATDYIGDLSKIQFARIRPEAKWDFLK